MVVALMLAVALGQDAQPSATAATPDRCEFLRAVLVAGWPSEPPEAQNAFFLDPQTRERPVFFEEDGRTRATVDAAFVADTFGPLDPEEAQALAPYLDEFIPYFQLTPPTKVDCEFPDLRVMPAQTSVIGAEDNQESLQFPRISLGEPMFSADGRFAIGGYTYSFAPYRWAFDDCLFEAVEGRWRIVECMVMPLDRQ